MSRIIVKGSHTNKKILCLFSHFVTKTFPKSAKSQIRALLLLIQPSHHTSKKPKIHVLAIKCFKRGYSHGYQEVKY